MQDGMVLTVGVYFELEKTFSYRKYKRATKSSKWH